MSTIRIGNFDEAIMMYDYAIKLNPYNAKTLKLNSKNFSSIKSLGKYREVIIMYDHALKIIQIIQFYISIEVRQFVMRFSGNVLLDLVKFSKAIKCMILLKN